ncbi:MAG TPA: PilZ domain-containing protein [Kofleriaceae bacterium]|nr:PilZ domain-containing protein [Kofleriaceae bacterium]
MALIDRPRHERRQHFRGRARPGRVLSVRFRAGSQRTWVPAETRNIGAGGAFIATSHGEPIGTALTVELVLPTSDRVFELPCAVRWVAPDGMGVEFVGVEVDVLLELNDYFATLTGK